MNLLIIVTSIIAIVVANNLENNYKNSLHNTVISANQTVFEESHIKKINDLSRTQELYGTTNMQHLTLANGVKMPVIALGTALIDKTLTPHIISAAIDLGYKAIDTAYIYGNEREVGQAVNTKIADGTVKREELFIISKLWSTFHRPDLVEAACKASLETMGLEYFDLYMIHNPMSLLEDEDPLPKVAGVLQYSKYDYLDAWLGMERLITKGLVRSIGVSNFNSEQIQKILDNGKIKPVMVQVECHPYLSQDRLQEFCAERNIALSCFGVLGSKGTPSEHKTDVAPVIDDTLVLQMAAKLNISPAKLLVRYQLQKSRNVVVKASSPGRLWDNLQALRFQLEEKDIEALDAMNKNKRMFTFKGMGDTHINYPFNEQF